MKIAGANTNVKRSRLMEGAAILGIAAVISKALGTLQKIPLQNIAGDGVFGIYNTVYPLYILILFVTTAGFPIALSTFVSERAARNEFSEARRVLRMAMTIVAVTGIVFFLLIFFGAKEISAFIGVPATARALQSVSFALLVVPLMAALRGYFQGFHDMIPTAVSQVAEQFIRVVTMVFLLLLFTRAGYGDDWVAAGATFGSVTGAVAGLVILLFYWRKHRKQTDYAADVPPIRYIPILKLARQFVVYALPICLGLIVLPILNIVDTFTMPRLLQGGGIDAEAAMRQFGLYHHGVPLVQLVAMVAASMAAALVPAITEAKARGEGSLVRMQTEQSLRLTWLIALAASFGLAMTAVPMNVMFYKSAAGSGTMMILAFTAVFSTLNIISAGILQGIGTVMVPARNLLIAVLIKLAGNILLIPIWGINGAAIAAVLAFAAAAGLNIMHTIKRTGASFPLATNAAKPFIAIVLMCAVIGLFMYGAQALLQTLPEDLLAIRAENAIVALGAVCLGAYVYAATLFRLGAVTQADLELSPHLGARILPLLVKMRWVR